MNVWEFVQKHVKTRVDYDGHFGAQCVDLFRQYCQDVLKIPHTGAVVGAKDIVERYDALPKEREHLALLGAEHRAARGDVAVWGAGGGNQYGHVAIVLEACGKNLVVFEQDGFAQSGARIAERSADGIIGYLRAYPQGE